MARAPQRRPQHVEGIRRQPAGGQPPVGTTWRRLVANMRATLAVPPRASMAWLAVRIFILLIYTICGLSSTGGG